MSFLLHKLAIVQRGRTAARITVCVCVLTTTISAGKICSNSKRQRKRDTHTKHRHWHRHADTFPIPESIRILRRNEEKRRGERITCHWQWMAMNGRQGNGGNCRGNSVSTSTHSDHLAMCQNMKPRIELWVVRKKNRDRQAAKLEWSQKSGHLFCYLLFMTVSEKGSPVLITPAKDVRKKLKMPVPGKNKAKKKLSSSPL